MSQADFPVVDEANFEAEVTQRPGVVLLDFWAEGCVPCKQLSRVLGEVAPTLPASARIAAVNVQDNPALVSRFNIRSVPTLVILKDGAVVETRTGVDRRQVIKKIVETYA